MTPSHSNNCRELEISHSPETPPLDPSKDDYCDDTCPGKTCLEEAEELARSADGDAEGRQSGGRGSVMSGTPTSRMVKSPSKPSMSPAAPTGNYITFSIVSNFILLKSSSAVAEKNARYSASSFGSFYAQK